MKYKFIHTIVNNQKCIEIILPKEKNILKQFLECEVQQNPYKTYIIDNINDVLNKKKTTARITGNMFELRIHRRKTIIINYIIAYECEPPVYDNETIYFIPTDELKEIIEIWLNEVKNSNQNKGDY